MFLLLFFWHLEWFSRTESQTWVTWVIKSYTKVCLQRRIKELFILYIRQLSYFVFWHYSRLLESFKSNDSKTMTEYLNSFTSWSFISFNLNLINLCIIILGKNKCPLRCICWCTRSLHLLLHIFIMSCTLAWDSCWLNIHQYQILRGLKYSSTFNIYQRSIIV